MAKFPVKLLPLIGVVLLLAAIGFFLLKSEKEDVEELNNDEAVTTADITAKKFNGTLIDSDGTVCNLEAESYSASRNDVGDEILLLEGFRLKRQQGDGLNLDLEGKSAEYNRTKNVINVSGDIKVKTSNDFMVYTQHLTLKGKENILISEDTVTFAGSFFTMTGKGLFMDLKKETLKILKDVNSTIDKESLNI